MPPGHPIKLLKSNVIQYGRRIGKKVYYRSDPLTTTIAKIEYNL